MSSVIPQDGQGKLLGGSEAGTDLETEVWPGRCGRGKEKQGSGLVVTKGDLVDRGGLGCGPGVGKLEGPLRSRLGGPWKECQGLWGVGSHREISSWEGQLQAS